MTKTVAQKMYNIMLPIFFFSFLPLAATVWYTVSDIVQSTLYITANSHLWIVRAKPFCSNSTGISTAIQQ